MHSIFLSVLHQFNWDLNSIMTTPPPKSDHSHSGFLNKVPSLPRYNLMYGFLVNSFSNWIFIFHIKRDSRMFQFLYNIQFLYNMARNHWKHVWKQLYVLLMRLIEKFTGVVYYVIVLLYFQPKFWLLEEILKMIGLLLWKSLTWSTQNWSLTLW